MSKLFKVLLAVFLSAAAIILVLFMTFLIVTKDVKLDENKLINPNTNMIICDDNGNEIVNASLSGKSKSVNVKSLNAHTVNAFIASEDRTFYKHGGLNYKRIIKALYKNVVSGSFKEGASTISQQLIKNTHLSHDKTIKRKLNEIKLTKSLERSYGKNEILEMYLNTIYFGHNCYGLANAAEFYFDKKAEDLTLNESATLVGLLTSPNNFSPFKNYDKSLSRRNTVLNSMHECGYIDGLTYETTVKEPINAKQSDVTGKNSDYIWAAFDEMESLDLDFYNLKNGSKIYTYLDPQMQNTIENMQFECDNSIIVMSDGKVNAFKSTIGNAKRQPGSTIKPFLVYAPAIEEKQISPFTKILDEKIDYNGYSPENYDKKYHGFVSVTDSIKHSYNVPAVKVLNGLTIPTAEKYLTKMNVKLDDGEKNLSLALGGMKYGFSLKEIADRYSVFSAGGYYTPSHFIKKIVSDNGKTVYHDINSKSAVFSEGTCSLMNEMLIETSKNGTAKKLSDFKFDVATKTGTCGTAEGNTDAYAISYTSDRCIGVWLGDKNNKKLKISSANDCCGTMKNILTKVYKDYTPANLDTTGGTQTVEIDAEDYYNDNKVILADPISPKLNRLTVKVLRGNEPKSASVKFSNPAIKTPTISVTKDGVCIELCQTKYYSYLIKRTKNGQIDTIYDGEWQNFIIDAPEKGCYVYTVTPYYLYEDKKIYGQEITLPAINLNNTDYSPQVKVPDIAKKDWFNL